MPSKPTTLLILFILLFTAALLTGCAPAEVPETPVYVPPNLDPPSSGQAAPQPGAPQSGAPQPVEPQATAPEPPDTQIPVKEAEPVTTAPELIPNQITSVIQYLRYAVENDDAARLAELSADTIGYTMYIEGGDFKPRQQLLDDFMSRAPSNPTCEGVINVSPTSGTYLVFFTGWDPPWVVSGYCYGDGCAAYDPPWTSTSTGFVLMRENDRYLVKYLFVNKSSTYLENSYNKTMLPCPVIDYYTQTSSGAGGAPGSCPGAPVQRVKVNDRVTVCTRQDGVAVRTEPSLLGELVTRLATGAVLEVIGGPACGNNFSWWQVRISDGSTGWIAEGGDAEDPYYICPVE